PTDTPLSVLSSLSLLDALPILRGDCKGNQRRRDVHIVERTAHRVLAADRAEAQLLLRGICTQQGGKRLAEALRILAQPLEVFLEDRKSTRLNSSHVSISYAVFC